MITDSLPRKAEKKDEYFRSDTMRQLTLPPPASLRSHAERLQAALKAEDRSGVQKICNAISTEVCTAFGIKIAKVKVLGARPREVTEKSEYELFGDYDFDTALIRIWMRTSVLEKPTSYGTFLSTLCHELCHHIDVVSLDLPHTFHTRGFYERAGLLYHHIKDTPVRPLVWDELRGGTFRINWPQTMRGSR